ncbi:MAG TPA: papain-like cysteine protease family protein [Alphaproteobacteria bacterium]|nr:papain-like cysteine protease family protein [Alphaproteobacteria bacterium]
MTALALLCLVACAQGDTPAGTEAAQRTLIAAGILHVVPTSNGFTISASVGNASQTRTVSAEQICEGATGSDLPPLAVMGCTSSVLNTPSEFLRQFEVDVLHAPSHRQHVELSGIERYWVHQSKINDCWAATLATARSFRRLYPMSQNRILSFAQAQCPDLESQRTGANAYQIVYVITRLILMRDGNAVHPHFCDDYGCIADSIRNQHPVIMLNSDHAELVVGMDYVINPNPPSGTSAVMPDLIYLLDPAGDGTVKNVLPLEICGADAFIAY